MPFPAPLVHTELRVPLFRCVARVYMCRIRLSYCAVGVGKQPAAVLSRKEPHKSSWWVGCVACWVRVECGEPKSVSETHAPTTPFSFDVGDGSDSTGAARSLSREEPWLWK